MRTVISFVGASDSGKTTAIEGLVPVLRARGYTVATVKHTSHGYEMDRSGSDSARHRDAGASMVAVVSDNRMAVDLPAPTLATVIARHLGDADLVLVEGFACERGPKVVVHRRGIEPKMLDDPSEVIAAVTDEPIGLPNELPSDSVEELADLIEERMVVSELELSLVVDGVVVPITEFVQRFLGAAVLGMVATLKGVSTTPGTVEVQLRRNGE